MTQHPDPKIQAIRDRNAQALADATSAPPPDIADDPRAYLNWAALPPDARPTAPTGQRPQATGTARPYTARPTPRRPARIYPAPADLEAERNRQLDALEALARDETRSSP